MILGLGTVLLIRRRARDLVIAEHLQRVDRIESIGQIASSIAHDFNNILTVIGGNLELAHSQMSEADPPYKRLTRALEGVERGRRMAGQLLAFARQQPASPHQTENICAPDVADLLRQAAQPCELRLRISGEKLFCVMDNSEFERALLNLVVNARRDEEIRCCRHRGPRDLTRQGGPAQMAGSGTGDYVACAVQDEGEGHPAGRASSRFRAFLYDKAGRSRHRART